MYKVIHTSIVSWVMEFKTWGYKICYIYSNEKKSRKESVFSEIVNKARRPSHHRQTTTLRRSHPG